MLLENSISKVKTYIGFAFKARKCVLGVDNLEKINRPILIVYSRNLSTNSIKKLNEIASKQGHKLIEIDEFEKISPREGCKALGVKDDNLASAIIKQLNI